MSVLIKNVDKELYRKFKAKAVLAGIKVGDALSLAIEKWLQDDNIISDEESARIKNNDTYSKLLPKLLEDHENEWIVISEGDLVGVFKSQNEAFAAVDSNKLYEKVNIVSPVRKPQQRVVRLGIRRKRYT